MITNFLIKLTVTSKIKARAFGKNVLWGKSEGIDSYWLAIGVAAAGLLVIGWPLFSSIISTVFTTIKNWFTTNLANIFTAVS